MPKKKSSGFTLYKLIKTHKWNEESYWHGNSQARVTCLFATHYSHFARKLFWFDRNRLKSGILNIFFFLQNIKISRKTKSKTFAVRTGFLKSRTLMSVQKFIGRKTKLTICWKTSAMQYTENPAFHQFTVKVLQRFEFLFSINKKTFEPRKLVSLFFFLNE